MQLFEKRRVKRRRSRWVKLGGLVATGAILWGTWKLGEAALPRYHVWKQNRALKQAKEFIAKRDAPNAQLALEVALREVRGNPDTIRVAADMLEQVASPQAMRLRRAVVQVAPDSAADSAALILCCLKFHDVNAAQDALSNTPHEVAVQLPMLHAALTFAMTTGNAPVAEVLFDQMSKAYPGDPTLKLSRALFHLRHPQEDERRKARADLNALAAADATLRIRIEREFVEYALQQKDYAEAKSRLASILASPEVTLRDRLQKANVDLLVDHRAFDDVFAEVAPLARTNDGDVTQFTQWLLVQNRATEAEEWLNGLPELIRTTTSARAALTDVVAQKKDWDRLSALLESGVWGPIPKDMVRLAFAAQTVNNPARPSLRRDTWDMAVDSAGSNTIALRVLLRLAALWGWPEESERTLWTIARTFPDQTWAHQALFNAYREKKDAKGMRDILGTLRDSDGQVKRYQYDWALLTSLLEPSSGWTPAKDILRKLYESDPINPSYATGYAFALAQFGKGKEAFELTEKLRPEDRDYPPRQPYLAFIYAVAKKPTELQRTVQLSTNLSMLPEENYLFTRAREEINRKPERPKPSIDTSATKS